MTRRFFTLSGSGFGPGFLYRSRIRLPVTVVIVVIYFSSSIKPKRRSFSSRQRKFSRGRVCNGMAPTGNRPAAAGIGKDVGAIQNLIHLAGATGQAPDLRIRNELPEFAGHLTGVDDRERQMRPKALSIRHLAEWCIINRSAGRPTGFPAQTAHLESLYSGSGLVHML